MRCAFAPILATCLCLSGIAFSNEDEPSVQLLVPGFSVTKLPVQLTNVNNLLFAPDGRLLALGYDGRIHVLRDQDGDGREETAEPFWDQPTLKVPIGMAWSDEGLYVASQGKVSLLRDTDDDGRADLEDVVASGWPRTDVTSGGVDAAGVALDREGNLYFGLICADYSNPYRLKDGKAHYDLGSVRGTIQKLSADRTHRETVATGIRVPYGLAFNRDGDLFMTDQEGETWLPGGNPLDELNHIIAGRHYGFPPRHPEHLPEVNDEPPIVGFGPQHQSTCGLTFNEPSPDRRVFGPPGWEGDALVAGFSRGKLWRVELVKTAHGYVGKPSLIAAFDMLVADIAISPAGELYVACHSGPPDWGTGPRGEGQLFKISLTDPEAPQPVAAWSAGPLEARVAFDRPLDETTAEKLSEARISFGDFVRAADRYEVLRPGYAAVKTQMNAPRGTMAIAAARLSRDRRTLILSTDPHPVRGAYAVTLPQVSRSGDTDQGSTVDLAYDLSGVWATWKPETTGSRPEWSGWLPHIDTEVALALTDGSSEHQDLRRMLAEQGRFTLKGFLETPPGTAVVRIAGKVPIEGVAGETPFRSAPRGESHLAEIAVEKGGRANEDQPLKFSLTVATGRGGAETFLHATYIGTEDPIERVLPLNGLWLPWTPPRVATATPAEETPLPPELAGGDRERGEKVFFSTKSNCSACHSVRGKGGRAGPDLGNLAHRDAGSVLRDIRDPSATINPDYIGHTVFLSDGRVLAGLVRSDGSDAIRVIDAEAKETVVPRAEIEEIQARSTSTMPTNLLDALNDQEARDLMAFLLTAAPDPQDRPEKAKAPPPRTRQEVEDVLRALPPDPLPGEVKRLTIVLVAGPKDHGPGEHDYPAWQRQWEGLLRKAAGVRVETAWEWPSDGQWKQADVVVFNLWNHDWSDERYLAMDSFLARGGGIVAVHAGLIADREPEKLARRFGLAAQPRRTKYRHGPVELTWRDSDDGHPIVAGMETTQFIDETYWPMVGDETAVTVLATATEEGKPRPMLWTFEPEAGRVFGCVLGHYAWTFDDPLFRIAVLRGLAWAAGEPVHRFQALAAVTESR